MARQHKQTRDLSLLGNTSVSILYPAYLRPDYAEARVRLFVMAGNHKTMEEIIDHTAEFLRPSIRSLVLAI